MLRVRLATARMSVLVLLAALTSTPAALAQKLSAKALLVRPDPAPDADASGKVKLVSKADEQELEIEVEDVDPAVTHDAFLEDAAGSGNLDFIGTLLPDGDDELELEFETDEGDALPFGVASVADLLGRRLEIVAGGEVVLFAILPADLAASGKFKAKGTLVRPADGVDPDAKAKVALVSEPAKGRERFGILAKNVDGLQTHDLYMDDGTGTLALVAPLGTGEDDDDGDDEPEAEFEAETKDGDALPLGVASTAELLGKTVDIYVGGVLTLTGVLPDAFEDDDGDQEVELELQRPDPAPDEDAEGEVEMEIDKNGFEEFEAEAERIDIAQTVELFIDGVKAADLVPDIDDLDELQFAVDTKEGESLPFGVASVADLLGRAIEIRTAAGRVLVGTVPGAFNAEKVKLKANAALTPVATATAAGKICVSSKAYKGDERLDVKATGLDFTVTAFHVFLETAAGSGTFDEIGLLQDQGGGKGCLKLRTKDGAALPFGAASVVDLANRALEIRDDGGLVHLEGVVPDPTAP